MEIGASQTGNVNDYIGVELVEFYLHVDSETANMIEWNFTCYMECFMEATFQLFPQGG